MQPTANLFNAVMEILWDDDTAPPAGKVATALASYVKNHRVNHENAFEVLHILFSDECKMSVRRGDEGVTIDEPGNVWYDVQFLDGSQMLLLSRNGIGSSLEIQKRP